MSLAVLNQVYTEARRLSIAGSNLAIGDFRLKKLVDPLEKSAQKAPVFGAVAKAIDKLVGGNEKESAQSLLDLCSLVLAILYTQGQTDVEGQTQPVSSRGIDLSSTQMSAGTIKPLIQALTSTGGGRLEVIREGFEAGAFQDIRLVNAAIGALDDNYGEIADFVTDNVLPRYGKAIVAGICDKIDIKGRAGNVRRLRLLHQLAPDLARPIILEAFENGSKEMRVAALECLGDAPEDLPHLLEQAESKNKEVRRVALTRLGKFKDDASVAILVKALGSADRSLAVESIRQRESEPLWQAVLATTKKEFGELFKLKDKEKLSKALGRFDELLGCYQQCHSPAAIEQLSELFEQRDAIKKLRGTHVNGEDVVASLYEVMFSTNEPGLLQKLIDNRDQMVNNRFVCALSAGLLVLSPTNFYELFSPYFIQAAGKSKRNYDDSPSAVISSLLPVNEVGQHGYGWVHLHRHYATPPEVVEELKKKSWDPRWLDAAIAADELQCAIRLGNAKHAGLKKYLLDRFTTAIKKKDMDYDIYLALRAIVDFNYPEATQCWIDMLQRLGKSQTRHYSVYYLAPLVTKLPGASAEAVEQSLVGMPESIVDQIVPHLQVLKAKKV